MNFNQKGVTLVELIVALALVSTIAAIAWTALSIGFEHTAVETSKTHMQQDANLIVTTLSNVHRTNEVYYLKFDSEGQLLLKKCPDESSCGTYKRLIDKSYIYNETTINRHVYKGTTYGEVKIEPKKENTILNLKLKGNKNSVSVKTTLTRIITGMK